MSRPLKICLAASEVAPLAKTGGLADVAAALTRYLVASGQDVRAFFPFYSKIDRKSLRVMPVEFLQELELEIGPRRFAYSVSTALLPGGSVAIYLIDCPALYTRRGIYTDAPDEPLRFAFLCRAVLDCCQRMGFGPDVFHCNDWHTALLPLYLKTHFSWDRLFDRSRTLLTIHNIAYQGICGAELLVDLGLGGSGDRLYQEDLAEGRINFLKTGILYADGLSTVSPTHARELLTPEHGRGLDGLLRRRAERFVGILNGVDYADWDPATDPHLPFHYSPEDLEGKRRNKQSLLEDLSLPYRPRTPVAGIVSRMTAQKGFDLLFETLPRALAERELQLVVLGTGEQRYESFFSRLESDFRGQACYYRGYSDPLAHRIEAGADVFLMPSLYEPCGLNQMYSLKYGTPPVVRRTGGLADSVELFDSSSGEGTGFVFEHFQDSALWWALNYALDTFPDRALWERLMLNGMGRDFSWERQGALYLELYERLLASRG